jgi:hypothetical protein
MAIKSPIVSKPAVKTAPVIVHESNERGFHRIVIHHNGITTAGQWVAYSAIAQHEGYLAATENFSGELPKGVFKTTAVVHTAL